MPLQCLTHFTFLQGMHYKHIIDIFHSKNHFPDFKYLLNDTYTTNYTAYVHCSGTNKVLRCAPCSSISHYIVLRSLKKQKVPTRYGYHHHTKPWATLLTKHILFWSYKTSTQWRFWSLGTRTFEWSKHLLKKRFSIFMIERTFIFLLLICKNREVEYQNT